jgi:hypothetical protein
VHVVGNSRCALDEEDPQITSICCPITKSGVYYPIMRSKDYKPSESDSSSSNNDKVIIIAVVVSVVGAILIVVAVVFSKKIYKQFLLIVISNPKKKDKINKSNSYKIKLLLCK